MSKDLVFFFPGKTRETERKLLEETLEGRPEEVPGAGACPCVGEMKVSVLEEQLLTQLSLQCVHVEWPGGGGGWNSDQNPPNAGTFLPHPAVLVEPLQARWVGFSLKDLTEPLSEPE